MNLCIPTLNRYDRLEECVRSALMGKLAPENIYIIDNGNSLDIDSFLNTFSDYKNNIYITSFGKNIGVSASWNWFLKTINSDDILISNDDIVFGRYDISNFRTAINYYPEFLFFKSQNIPAMNMFSCFSMRKRLRHIVGPFDEKFYPAYFEDNDFHYRMKLNGMESLIMDVETGMTHRTSSTIGAFDQIKLQEHHRNFEANKQYYIDKWGGLPGKEKFTREFDAPF